MARAQAYRELDKNHERHHLAYLTMAARSTIGSGQNVRAKYPTFRKFFDYRKELERLEKPKGKQATMKNWIAYRKRKEEESNG